MRQHQRDMVEALAKMPRGVDFRVRDTRAAGYPHKDASGVLQSELMLMMFVSYAVPSYRNGVVYYRHSHDFDRNRERLTT